MSKIGKIIIAIALVYIATLLLIIDFNDVSWETNRDSYYRIIAAFVIVLIQFIKRKK